jgi:TldD protein
MRSTVLAVSRRSLPGNPSIRRVTGSGALLFALSLFNLTLPCLHAAAGVPAGTQKLPPLLDTMTLELNRAMGSLGKPGLETKSDTKPDAKNEKQVPPYFLSYSVADAAGVSIRAQYGALVDSQDSRQRVVDVQVRVGEPKLDNTHGTHRGTAVNTMQLPITDDHEALERSLWLATNSGYGTALDNYLRVKTEAEVRAKEEDSSGDFSTEQPQVSVEKPAPAPVVDKAAWEDRVRSLSKIFRAYPDVYQNIVMLTAQSETDYFVSSEGSRLAHPHQSARLIVFAVSRAEDGMDLFRAQTFEAETVDGLPKQAELAAAMNELGKSLEELRKAPVTEPFNGPAILSGRAAAVFFHEVLGHRLEGQRQRGDEEGQTFTKEVNKPVLPSFLSVSDDPTRTKFGNTWLSGTYDYDDEGQKAKKVDLIQDGVLKTFLMSRLPIASFSNSNGHGRAQTGRVPNGRQGNLIVTSTKAVPESELRTMLIDEAKKQGKPYGLYFEDISSGFAVTTRNSPQAFQVIPLVVYRVYVDGRPDELVRGVSIVGTPLAAMKRILATGDKSEVFNGECGAESGSIPVSAVAPAMLLTEMETQRQPQGTERVPILPNPSANTGTATQLAGKGN